MSDINKVYESDHLISVKGVGKSYKAGDTLIDAVKSMDLYIDDGEFVSIMGPSGSGKSTLLSILAGLNRPTKGRLIVDTMDIYALSSEQQADFRSEYIGFIFQSFQLVSYLTVLENVKLPMAITGLSEKEQYIRAKKALTTVGLADKEGRLPDQLSGGEQERVAIARAVVNDPPILLADEPTGNLDSENASQVLSLLNRLNAEGKTIIMVTHDPEMGKKAHRLIRVKDGSILN